MGLIAAVAGTVIALDALTKWAATQYLAGERRSEVLGGLFHLNFYRNFAGPDNAFQGHTALISVLGILAVLAIFLASLRVTRTLTAVAIGLLLGGAIGNLLDRLLREPSPLHGGVIDWLQIASRAQAMNLADIAINIGVGLILIAAILAWIRNDDAPEPHR
ncbi:MAG TPA: signal peptidase II [Solirubrobacterales bacterium]|nr:signal peptidase II [Solirubrobacterales bacterium]